MAANMMRASPSASTCGLWFTYGMILYDEVTFRES
jgi:hypothetical protein